MAMRAKARDRGERTPATALSREEVLWALAALAHTHRIPFDATLAGQQLAVTPTFDTLTQSASALGLKCDWREVTHRALASLPVPVLVVLSPPAAQPQEPALDTPAEQPGTRDLPQLALLLKVEADRVALLECGQPGHTTVSQVEFRQRYLGLAFQASPKVAAPADPDSAAQERAAFRFRWFVVELL